jgi:hypothetical protein
MALVPWQARILWGSSDYLDKMATDANGLPALQVQHSEVTAVQQGCANKDSSSTVSGAAAAVAAAAAAAAPDWITALTAPPTLAEHCSTAVQCSGG